MIINTILDVCSSSGSEGRSLKLFEGSIQDKEQAVQQKINCYLHASPSECIFFVHCSNIRIISYSWQSSYVLRYLECSVIITNSFAPLHGENIESGICFTALNVHNHGGARTTKDNYSNPNGDQTLNMAVQVIYMRN